MKRSASTSKELLEPPFAGLQKAEGATPNFRKRCSLNHFSEQTQSAQEDVESISISSKSENWTSRAQNAFFPSFDGCRDSTAYAKKDIQAEICSDRVFLYLQPKVRLQIRQLASRFSKEWDHLATINDKIVMLRKISDGAH